MRRTATAVLALGLLALASTSACAQAAPAWLPPVTVSAPGQPADQPQIATGGRGETVAVWRRFDGTHWIIQVSIRPFEGSFSAPIDLSSPGEDADDPRVGIGGAG